MLIRLIFCWCLFFTLISAGYSQKKSKYTISGSLEGALDGTWIFLVRNKINESGLDTVNKVLVKKGKFQFKGKLPFEGMEHFIFIDTAKYGRKFRKITIILENGSLRLKGGLDALSITNNELNVARGIRITGANAHNEYISYLERQFNLIDSINNLITMAYNVHIKNSYSKDGVEKYNKVQLEAPESLTLFKDAWIRDNPNSLITPWLIYKKRGLSVKELKEKFSRLAPSVKKSYWGVKLSNLISIEEKISIGVTAPGFSFPSNDGTYLTLSELVSKSKLTILDFWASWCGPCRTDFPLFKKLYLQYKNKGLSILQFSIDENKDEDAWKDIISKYNLNWNHVRQNEKEFAFKNYNITKIPAIFLLDSKGQIIAKELYGEDLEKKIEEMLGEVSNTNYSIRNKQFLDENTGRAGVISTTSGLQYEIIREGTGPKPDKDSHVKIDYTVSLIDRSEVYSTYKEGQPEVFPLNATIDGWKEAIQLMALGSKWRLYVPADLAYGEIGSKDIPAGSTVIFEIELLEIFN